MRMYFLWSNERFIVGVFSSRPNAEDFARQHGMLDGWFIEDATVDSPNVFLKDGTY